MKKISALFLSVVMLASLLGGCSRPTLEGIESTGQEEVRKMRKTAAILILLVILL